MIRRWVATAASVALAVIGCVTGIPALAAPEVAPPAGFIYIDVPVLPNGQQPPRLLVSTAELERAQRATPVLDEIGKETPKPVPPAVGAGERAASMVACGGTCRFYSAMWDDAEADLANGLETTMTIGKPNVASGSEHSVGEVAVFSEDGNDLVEVGWRVNTVARPDGNPILFAYHWINDAPQGYGVGFTDVSSNPVNLGAGLPKPVNKLFFIGSTTTHYWVGYDTDWVAYVAKSRWGTRPFSASGDSVHYGQSFYEVASTEDKPCTDLGTGWGADPPVSGTATMQGFHWYGSGTAVDVVAFNSSAPDQGVIDPDVYNTVKINATTFRGGGPGWNAAGTAVGTQGAC